MNEKKLMEKYGINNVDEIKIEKMGFDNEEKKRDINGIILFSHNSYVKVINGFYKGYNGIIKDYMIDRDRNIFYKVEVKEMENAEIIFKQSDLGRGRKKIFGIL